MRIKIRPFDCCNGTHKKRRYRVNALLALLVLVICTMLFYLNGLVRLPRGSMTVGTVGSLSPGHSSSAPAATSWKPPQAFQSAMKRKSRRVSDPLQSAECRRLTPVTVMDQIFLPCHEDDMVLGLKEFLHVLYAHQHPADCSNKKFAILYDWPWGVGSLIQVTVRQAKAALALDRIFVLEASFPDSPYHNSSANFFYDPAYCQGDRFWPCYFLPVTNCTLSKEDILQAVSIDLFFTKNNTDAFTSASQLLSLQDRLQVPRVVLMQTVANSLNRLMPMALEPWFQACLPQHKNLYERHVKTFLLRFNPRTRRELALRRKAIFGDQSIPRGTISMHVRKGDKHTEMKVAEDDDFLATARYLATAGNYTHIFVSTEDKAFIERSNSLKMAYPPTQALQVLYTAVPRYSPTDHLSPMKHAQTVGRSREILNNLVNLELAGECDGFIGQIGSNWVVLINDFRSSFACKARRPFLRVAPGSAASIQDLLVMGGSLSLEKIDPQAWMHGVT